MSARPDASSRGERERLRQEQAAQRVSDRRLLAIAAVVVVVLLVGGGIGFQWWRTARSPSVPAASSTGAGFAPVTLVDGKPLVLGKAGAPVVVQLYADFHCPHCADFEERMGPAIAEQQDAGRVSVELYPMSFIDAGSTSAANAMACAAENGFGQPYYSGLFANPTLRWNDQQLVDLATKVGVSAPEGFASCVTSDAHQDWVTSINATAKANGVTSTPTVFVDGKLVGEATLTPAGLAAMISTATVE
jgi:protein-disulfide isomerase